MFLLFAGCGEGGTKYMQGRSEAGEWYVDVDGYRYIQLGTSWWGYKEASFNTFIGKIENSNIRLYADDTDPNKLLLKQTAIFEDRLTVLVREDLFPDELKDRVAYFSIYSVVINSDGSRSFVNDRIIDDKQGIEELNELLFSKEQGLKSSSYELTENEGWTEAYGINYFYAQTDKLFWCSEILLSPENEYYLPVLSGEYLKIEDGRLKELITEIP
jgi:hypothetical protein